MSGPGCSPTPPAPEEPQHTLEQEPGKPLCSCLGFPQGPHPLWGVRNTTLHRKPSHWMGGLHPPHTCNLWAPNLTCPTRA